MFCVAYKDPKVQTAGKCFIVSSSSYTIYDYVQVANHLLENVDQRCLVRIYNVPISESTMFLVWNDGPAGFGQIHKSASIEQLRQFVKPSLEIPEFFIPVAFALVGPITATTLYPSIDYLAQKSCVLDRLTVTMQVSSDRTETHHYFLIRYADVVEFAEPLYPETVKPAMIYDERGIFIQQEVFGLKYKPLPDLIDRQNPLIRTMFTAMAKRKVIPLMFTQANLDSTGKATALTLRFWGPEPLTVTITAERFIDEFDPEAGERRRLLTDERLLRALPLDTLRKLVSSLE